jgi:hypothetical protein
MVQRRNISSHLDQNLIQEILRILSDVAKNPYIHHFKILGQYGNIEEYNIELNSSISVDQRRFNAPAMDQVAAIWQDDSDEQRKFKRSIMIYANSGHATFIRDYHGCYDSLAYPLFYPGGETGWEDKTVLLEENSVPRFPRVKRKYTKRKNKGTSSMEMFGYFKFRFTSYNGNFLCVFCYSYVCLFCR